jgi:DNA modification methylase
MSYKIEYVEIDDLTLFERNPKKHPSTQIKRLVNSMEEFGWTNPILAIRHKNQKLVIAGHARLEAALKLNIKEVPIIFLDLPYEKAIAYNVADNKLAELAEWDEDLLAELLSDFKNEDFFEALGFDDDELDALFNDGDIEITEDDFEINEEVIETDIEIGDVFKLDRHRLMCGDSTNPDHVGKLMGGAKITLAVTSPPYFNARDYASWDSFEEYIDDMQKVIENMIKHSGERFLIVWNVAPIRDKHGAWDIPSHTSVLMKQIGLEFYERIIWKKKGAVFDVPRSQSIEQGHYFPAYAFEDIIVYGKKHPPFDIKDKRKIREWQTNVWEFQQVRTNNPEDNEGHPAQFPVELPYRAILSYSQENQNICDPLGGSGTTLIAAEQLNRTCYMMELDPAYCQVIINRWENLTGQKVEML